MKQSKSIDKQPNTTRYIGFFIICCICIGITITGVWLIRTRTAPAAEQTSGDSQSERTAVVVTYPVIRTFEQVIAIQGNVQAENIAMVSPRIPGVIEEIFVDEGDTVAAGETELFQTDAVKLQQNVTISEHNLSVALCAQRQAEANLEKVTADFEKAELDFKRFERLLAQEATTQDIFEQQQSHYKQLAASQKVSQAQVELAAEQVSQAEAALAIARKDLADTKIAAPISGVVSMRTAEPGEMGTPGVPVLRIEDINTIEVSAFLPATVYPSVVTGRTLMRIEVAGVDLGERIISYKSPTIQPKLRTFEIKCLLQDPPAEVAPGAMADIEVILISRESLGVPVVSIQQRAGQSVVFVIEDNIARQTNVLTGLESDGWIELLDDNVNGSMQVVSMGQDMLDDGVTVSIQKEAE